jgi:hypothetical protein
MYGTDFAGRLHALLVGAFVAFFDGDSSCAGSASVELLSTAVSIRFLTCVHQLV